jgi:hypothetical protein
MVVMAERLHTPILYLLAGFAAVSFVAALGFVILTYR